MTALEQPEARLAGTAPKDGASTSVVMMFPGGGVQYPGAGQDLFDTEPVFRDAVNRCLTIAARLAHSDLRGLMFPAPEARERAAIALERPDKSILAVFTIEYALAQLWMSWGVKPAAYHRPQSRRIRRGLPRGRDVARLRAGDRREARRDLPAHARRPDVERARSAKTRCVRCRCRTNVSIAAVNAPELTVVSGTVDAIAALHEIAAARRRGSASAAHRGRGAFADAGSVSGRVPAVRGGGAAASGDAAVHFESHRRLVRSAGSRDGGLLDASSPRHGAVLAGSRHGARRRPPLPAGSRSGSHADDARAPASRRWTRARRDRVTACGARQTRIGRAHGARRARRACGRKARRSTGPRSMAARRAAAWSCRPTPSITSRIGSRRA